MPTPSLFYFPFFLISKLSPADRFSPLLPAHMTWRTRPSHAHTSAYYHKDFEVSSLSDNTIPPSSHGRPIRLGSRVATCKWLYQLFLFQVRPLLLYRSYSHLNFVPASRADLPFLFLILHFHPVVTNTYCSGVEMQTGREREVCRPPRSIPLFSLIMIRSSSVHSLVCLGSFTACLDTGCASPGTS
jgi:hypothetical protein